MRECSKCKGPMVLGFIVDRAQGGKRFVSGWIEGEPRRAFWKGVTAPDVAQIPIGTFRCDRCGFLESYASAEFGAQQ